MSTTEELLMFQNLLNVALNSNVNVVIIRGQIRDDIIQLYEMRKKLANDYNSCQDTKNRQYIKECFLHTNEEIKHRLDL